MEIITDELTDHLFLMNDHKLSLEELLLANTSYVILRELPISFMNCQSLRTLTASFSPLPIAEIYGRHRIGKVDSVKYL